jgi:hypothetical protein
MRALGLTMLLVPSIAFAQPAVLPAQPLPPPVDDTGECTVTTTVRCTGAAAPYAVQAAQPQAPVIVQQAPVVVQPPVVAPVAPAAPAAPPQPLMVIDARHLVGEGWKLTQSEDGRLWRERRVSTDSPAMWGTGLTIWLGTYAAGILAGMVQGGIMEIGWMPIVGAMCNAGFSGDGSGKALWAVDSLAQGTGFVLFLVGLAAGPQKMERLPVSIGPVGFVGGGSGVALSARF